MFWLQLGLAAVVAAVTSLFYFAPFSWCRSSEIQAMAAFFVFLTAALYIGLMDDERKPTASPKHRILVGALAGTSISAILQGPAEAYALGALLGGLLGYVGTFNPENWSSVNVRFRVSSRESYLEMKRKRFTEKQIIKALKEVMLAWISYDEHGNRTLAVERSWEPPSGRPVAQVIERMNLGEIRRVWFPESRTIVDYQLRGFVRDAS